MIRTERDAHNNATVAELGDTRSFGLIRGNRVDDRNRPAHDGSQAGDKYDCPVRTETASRHVSNVREHDAHRRWSAVPA